MNKPSVGELMTRDVVAVAPETSVETAARLLSQHGISGAPVVATSKKPIGVISLFDLVDVDRPLPRHTGYPMFYRIGPQWSTQWAADVTTKGGRVEEVMTPSVVTIDEHATLFEATTKLLELGIHRLLVTDEGGVLVGMVSAIDLLRGFVGAPK